MPLIISTPTASSAPSFIKPLPHAPYLSHPPATQTLPHLIPAMIAEEDDRTASLITRDFLGGGGLRPSNSGELEPGKKAYLDLNLMPNSDLKLGLGLGMETEAIPRRFGYESVCTLDKVRSALERAERETRGGGGGGGRKRTEEGGGASTSSSTTTSSVRRRRREEESYEAESTTTTMDSSAVPPAAAAMMVAGCPRCLLYVLICKGNPRCPRCGTHVPVAVMEGKKRARVDLNASI